MTDPPPETPRAKELADRALTLWNEGDTPGAERLWLEAAELGSTRAMINLGRNRLDMEDFDAASSWFLKAYQLKDVQAALLLAGTSRLQGDAAGEDHWSWRAFELGNTAVLVYMARQKGHGEESFDVSIMRTAAEAGDFDACGLLSVRCFNREEYHDCIEWGEKAISLQQATTDIEQVARIHGLVSSAYTLLHRFLQAAEHARTAKSLAPAAVPTITDDHISNLDALARQRASSLRQAAGAPSSVLCASCGERQPDQLRFCPFCGARVAPAD